MPMHSNGVAQTDRHTEKHTQTVRKHYLLACVDSSKYNQDKVYLFKKKTYLLKKSFVYNNQIYTPL